MGFKSFLGSVSPLYGAVTGQGMMGQMLNPAEAAKIAREEQARQDAAAEQTNKERQANITAQAASRLKKGGSVKSASSRADGCALRGKTRA